MRIAFQRKELVEVAARDVRPFCAVGRNGKLRPAAFRFEMPADEGVGTGDLPHNRARLAVSRRQTLGAGGDVLNLHRALLPHLAAEIRPVFPQAVADVVRVEELVG